MQIIMPKLGLTMTHGTITEWLKAPGDAVKAEEALCAYETEKVTLELSAPEDGVLAEILAPAGTTVPAGAAVCEFVTGDEGRRTKDGGQGTGIRSQAAGDGSQAVAGDPQLPASTPAERAVQLPASGPLNATPKARALARELGVDLTGVAGSGPDGQGAGTGCGSRSRRCTACAHQGHAVGRGASPRPKALTCGALPAPARKGWSRARTWSRRSGIRRQASGVRSQWPAPDRSQQPQPSSIQLPATSFQLPASSPHSSLRRTIAERMSQSAFTAPHVTLMTEAEATNLVSARAQLNAEVPAADKISYNTLLAALTARALREHPNVNARWEADGIRLLAEINIALAVDTERGLMTPVLREVDKLSLSAVQRGYAALLDRALAGRSLPDDFADGTFTITNLGGLDVDGFTPIINPPQAAILGVGRIVEKPVARDGAVVIRPMMTLSLSFDHRIVDGAPAAKFLQRIKQLVERPMALLLRAET